MFLTAVCNARWQQLYFQGSLAPLSQRSTAISRGLVPQCTALVLLTISLPACYLYAVTCIDLTAFEYMSFLQTKEVPTSLTASCLSLFIFFLESEAVAEQSPTFRFSAMKHV